MKTHTPGPWTVQPDPEWAGKHPAHDHRFITSGTKLMTDDDWLHDPACTIICSLRDCANQEANARLIAAAPLMPDEIIRLMDCLDDIRQMAEARKTCIRMADGTMLNNYCRQAIRKADEFLNKHGLNKQS